MKKIMLLLLVLLGLGISCSSDSDKNEGIKSSIVVDGISFNPDKGVYFYQTASFESQKEVRFLVSNEKKNENLYIDISFPSNQKDLTGIYNFGPGTAADLLVSCELVTAETRYYILGYTLNIKDLGDSKFSFEFINPEAFDHVKNKKVTFKGELSGKFELRK